MYVFNFERRTSKLRNGFLIVICLCVCTTSITDFSRLLSFEDIEEISAGGSLKSSRVVSAARSSASLAKNSYSTCDKNYPALFDVVQPRVEYISLQL